MGVGKATEGVEEMKPGTKAYFRSLLKSEGLRATDDDIIYVEDGWTAALNDTNEQRREWLPKAVAAYEKSGNLIPLGYLTYVYGYTQVRMREPEPVRVEQLPLFEHST